MAKAIILIVEDEEDILDLLEYNLSKEGYETIGALNANSVEKMLDEENIDVLIMDRNLPNCEGSELVEKLRKKGYSQPVVFLTAKDKEEDKLEGFEAGGDDYITKPFSVKELLARVNAMVKRAKKDTDTIKIKDILYKEKSKEFFIDGKFVDLTQLERALLLELIKNQGVLLSRDYLLSTIWKDGYDKKEKTVNVAIKRLKEKIDYDKTKNYIKSIRGEGYMFC